MFRFPSSRSIFNIISNKQHGLAFAATVSSCLRFSSSSNTATDEIPSTSEILSAFKIFGLYGTSLHDLSRKQNGDEQSIKKKFLELAKQQHPDVVASTNSNNNSKKPQHNMSEINGAYKVLKNFYKAGGFPKFAPGSSSSSFGYSNENNSHHNNQQPYPNGTSSSQDGEFFWSGFEDVMKNNKNFHRNQHQHPNTFYQQYNQARGTTGNGSTSFGDEDEFLKYQSEAAAAAEFFAQQGQGAEFTPAEMYEYFRRFQEENGGGGFEPHFFHHRNQQQQQRSKNSQNGNSDPFYQEFAKGNTTRYDDARSMRDAEAYFAHYANMMGGDGDGEDGDDFANLHHHVDGIPFDFVDFDPEDMPPHMFAQFINSQQQHHHHNMKRNNNNNNNGKNRKNHNNNGKMKRNHRNSNKPWMNPDEFFDEGFHNPQKTNNHPHQQRPQNNNQNNKQNVNSAGFNLSPEEYEAILTMHSEGRSFSFIANALGLSEKQAIAGFNVAKKQKSEASRNSSQERGDEKTNKTNNVSAEKEKNANGVNSKDRHDQTGKNVDGKSKSRDHDESVEYVKNSKNSEKQVFDVDDDDDAVESAEPFDGKPLHHHPQNNKNRQNHNHSNNDNSNNNRNSKRFHHKNNNNNHHHAHNNHNKSKWRKRR